MTSERREPQINLHLVNGVLWAETTINGTRSKWQPTSLTELKLELAEQSRDQAKREKFAAATRHTAVFTAVATDHDLALACRTIGGKIPKNLDKQGETWTYFHSDQGRQAAAAAKAREQSYNNKPNKLTSREIPID